MAQGFWNGDAIGTIRDGANLDAFSRVRVSNPTSLFSAQASFDSLPSQMEQGATGTGIVPAFDDDLRMIRLAADAGSGTSYLQSYEYIPYQPGRSQLIFLTFVLGAGVAGRVVDLGSFDAANGLFLRQNGVSGLQVVIRSSTSGSPVDRAVNRTDWNLDRLDGNGPSGVILDENLAQILVIDAQFLGMGRVRFGFDVGGAIVYVHQFRNANDLSVPYMQSLTLPVQVLLTATGVGANTGIYVKCAAVTSEGGYSEADGYQFSTPERTITAASGARTAVFSIRPAALLYGLPNRQKVRFDSLEILVTGNTPIFWELGFGATWSANPAFQAINATYSGTEISTQAAPGTITTLPLIAFSGYVASSAQSKGALSAGGGGRSKYILSLDRAGAQHALGTLTLVATGVGAAVTVRALINFTEIR